MFRPSFVKKNPESRIILIGLYDFKSHTKSFSYMNVI